VSPACGSWQMTVLAVPVLASVPGQHQGHQDAEPPWAFQTLWRLSVRQRRAKLGRRTSVTVIDGGAVTPAWRASVTSSSSQFSALRRVSPSHTVLMQRPPDAVGVAYPNTAGGPRTCGDKSNCYLEHGYLTRPRLILHARFPTTSMPEFTKSTPFLRILVAKITSYQTSLLRAQERCCRHAQSHHVMSWSCTSSYSRQIMNWID
jgi:hypothetical protein